MAFITIVLLSGFMMLAMYAILIMMVIGSFVLQFILSKLKNPWAGLILPALVSAFVLYLCVLSGDFLGGLVAMRYFVLVVVLYVLIYLFCRNRRKKQMLNPPEEKKQEKKQKYTYHYRE